MLIPLVVTVAALVIPPGMHREQRFEPAASSVAGKPVSVYCADDLDQWGVIVRGLIPGRDGVDTAGFADRVGGDAEFLSPTTCLRLIYAASASVFGSALQVLAHESLHLSGMSDESETDCTALLRVVPMSWFFFDLRAPALNDVLAGAIRAHRAAPPMYQGRC